MIPIVRDARLVVITSCVHFGFEPVVVAEAAVADTVLASIHVVLVPLLVASPDAGTLSSVGIIAVICCECPVSIVSADVSDSLIRFTSATYLLPVPSSMAAPSNIVNVEFLRPRPVARFGTWTRPLHCGRGLWLGSSGFGFLVL